MIMTNTGRRAAGVTRRAVVHLLGDQPRTISELAGALGHTTGGLRTTMNALETEGLVERTAVPGERAARYALTEVGRESAAEAAGPPVGMLGSMRLLSLFDEGRGGLHDALRLVSRE